MTAESQERSGRWSRLRQDVGAVLWPSFLAASLGTMVFFAFFDPQLLGLDDHPPWWAQNRMTGYGIGFFFFWLMCTVSSAVTLYLVRTAPDDTPPGDAPDWMRDAP